MNYLILNTDYPEFLNWLYAHSSELDQRSYEDQMRVRNESFYAVEEFYPRNLSKLVYQMLAGLGQRR